MKKLIFILIFHLVFSGCSKEDAELYTNFIDGKFVYTLSNIHTRNLNWTNERELTSDAVWKPGVVYGYYDPLYVEVLWSNDGSQILYLKTGNTYGSTIGIMDSNGKNNETVLHHDNRDNEIGAIDWSHDGKWIAYSYLFAGSTGPIHIVSINGQEQKVINEHDDSYIEHISWSSDSEKIAYYNGGELIIMDIESEKELFRKTKVWGMYSKPLWSPDDKYIVYNTAEDRIGKILLLDVNDESEKIIQEEGGPFDVFCWTSDGKYIVYFNYNTGFNAMQISTGKVTELVYKSHDSVDNPKGDLFIFD